MVEMMLLEQEELRVHPPQHASEVIAIKTIYQGQLDAIPIRPADILRAATRQRRQNHRPSQPPLWCAKKRVDRAFQNGTLQRSVQVARRTGIVPEVVRCLKLLRQRGEAVLLLSVLQARALLWSRKKLPSEAPKVEPSDE